MEDITSLSIVAGIMAGSFAVMKALIDLTSKTIRARRNGKNGNPGAYQRRDAILSDLDDCVKDMHRVVMEPVPNRVGQYMIWRPEQSALIEEIKRLAQSINGLSEIVYEQKGWKSDVLQAVQNLKTG